MLKAKSFLAVDFGAGTLKLAEFEVNEAGGLRLKQYALKPLGPEGAQESTREAAVQKALQELVAASGTKAKSVNVCAPGFHVFSKFVKLPPVDAGKVTQIIQYEAQQNVPFPLEEVVWAYQILGASPGGELEVLLVAIKADIVEGLFKATESAGLSLQLTDVSAAALCNAFRYNYPDLEDCTMLLDIGAKTSNLLFFEKGKVFARSINLGANSITQDFVNERKSKKVSWAAAEKIKIEDGFVSLGGAYEEPENEDAAAFSKIARQFMTRLHIQVNQTMQFYRGQQGGSAPVRLFLSGGASIMPYTAQFFAEKINVPVEYFNPLRNVQIDPSINLEELARVAHSLGELVGLGLRNMAHCPVELNLMPASTLKWQSFNQKKPYFIASVFSLVAVIAAVGLLFDRLAGLKQAEVDKIASELAPKQTKSDKFKREYNQLKQVKAASEQLVEWIDDRFYWADALSELRQILVRVEATTKAKYRVEPGVWIEQLITVAPRPMGTIPGFEGMGAEAGASPTMPGVPMSGLGMPSGAMSEEAIAFARRYGPQPGAPAPVDPALAGQQPAAPVEQPMAMPEMPQPGGEPGMPPPLPGEAGMQGSTTVTNDPSAFTITFRAISIIRSSNQPEANKSIAYSVVDEIKASSKFDPQATRFVGDVGNEEPPGTFTFSVTTKLKRQLKL